MIGFTELFKLTDLGLTTTTNKYIKNATVVLPVHYATGAGERLNHAAAYLPVAGTVM